MLKKVRRRLANGEIKEYSYERKKTKNLPTMRDIIIEYKQSADFTKLAVSTKKNYTYCLDLIMEAYGDYAVCDIKRRTILNMRDSYKETPGMANQILTAWSILMLRALDDEIIDNSPYQRIKRLSVGEGDPWPEEATAFAIAPGNLPEYFRRAVVLGLHTGQRGGDVISMTWDKIKDGLIAVKQKKTGAEVWVPIHPDLQAELEVWKLDRTDKANTIVTAARGYAWTENSWHIIPGRIFARYPVLDGLVFHGLRHEAATRLAEAGCSEREIMSITGHQNARTVGRYTKKADLVVRAKAAMGKLKTSETEQVEKRSRLKIVA